MSRVEVHHLTRPHRLPAIELEGLRTRADLSTRLGPIDAFDRAAPGTYANGKRVSAWWSAAHAASRVGTLGAGLVTFTVDPARVLALPAHVREADPAAAWGAARPLSDWLAGGAVPDDLEVHQNLPVRVKHVALRAPLLTDADLGAFAPLVAAIADTDRVAAKLVMHLALAASGGDHEDAAFLAACALAWRDAPDAPDLSRRTDRSDAEAVLTATLTEQRGAAPEATARLTLVLDELRMSSTDEDDEGAVHAALYERSADALARISRVP